MYQFYDNTPTSKKVGQFLVDQASQKSRLSNYFAFYRSIQSNIAYIFKNRISPEYTFIPKVPLTINDPSGSRSMFSFSNRCVLFLRKPLPCLESTK